ncbi:MAG: tetratricopeptide repeat protein [Planctomycetes bacterium]|nr:tetratricopeptide repeat protein [Planctomycetota bacterium]
MDTKELIAVLVLAVLVGAVVVLRPFSFPVTASAERPRLSSPRRGNPPQPGRDSGNAHAAVPLWPRLGDAVLPRDPAARRLFDAAETLYAEGLLDPAVAAYTHFNMRCPDEPAAELALLRLGQCHTLLRRHKEAADSYERFLAKHPESDLRPMALLWSADSLVHLRKPEPARQRLNEILTRHAKSPFAEGAKALLDTLDAPKPAPPKTKTP